MAVVWYFVVRLKPRHLQWLLYISTCLLGNGRQTHSDQLRIQTRTKCQDLNAMPQRKVSLKTPCRSSSTDCSEDLEHLYHYFAFLKRPVWPMSDVLVLLFHPLKYIYSGNLYRIAPEGIYRSYQIYIYWQCWKWDYIPVACNPITKIMTILVSWCEPTVKNIYSLQLFLCCEILPERCDFWTY